MVWTTPKTDWAPANGVAAADLNRIEGNTAELKTIADAALPKNGSQAMTGGLKVLNDSPYVMLEESDGTYSLLTQIWNNIGHIALRRKSDSADMVDMNFSADGKVRVFGNEIFAGGDLIFERGRPGKASMYWNASSSVDFGIDVKIEDTVALTIQKGNLLAKGTVIIPPGGAQAGAWSNPLVLQSRNGSNQIIERYLQATENGEPIWTVPGSANYRVWAEHNQPYMGGAGLSQDLNTISRVGRMGFYLPTVNRPPGMEYGMVDTMISHDGMDKTGTNWLFQTAYATNTDVVYSRKKIDGGDWTAWKPLAFPVNETRANNADLNNYTTAGVYAMGAPVSNAPTGWAWGTVTVKVSGDVVTQVLENHADPVWIRARTGGGGWQPWKKVGGGVKSVQRGTFNLAGGTTNIAINAVDLSKAVLITTAAGSTNNGAAHWRATLTSATNIEFAATITGGGLLYMGWQVVEYD